MIVNSGWWPAQIEPIVRRATPPGCTLGQLVLALWPLVPPENAARHYMRRWAYEHEVHGWTSPPPPLAVQIRVGLRALVQSACKNMMRSGQLRLVVRDGVRHYILGTGCGVTGHAGVTDPKRSRVRARSVAALDSPRAPSAVSPSRAGAYPAGHSLSA